MGMTVTYKTPPDEKTPPWPEATTEVETKRFFEALSKNNEALTRTFRLPRTGA